jgi:ribose 5-phosphate isomerase A
MTGGMSEDRDHLKRLAAYRAVEEIEDGMILGLGTGSTAAHVLERLSERVARGLTIKGIPTSERTAAQARRLGIPITSFAEHHKIDLTIDGADEVERGTLNLIKGLGGALLREKIVAAASARFIVVVDDEKIVGRLGEHTPVPVEVAQFGWQATARALERLGCVPELRHAVADRPYVTDGGNFILDCRFRSLSDPARIEREIATTVGTIESGLFVARSSAVIVASAAGVEVLTPPAHPRGKPRIKSGG